MKNQKKHDLIGKVKKKIDQLFNIKFNEEYVFGNRINETKRAITIKNVHDLNRNRIKADYSGRDNFKKTVTNKY